MAHADPEGEEGADGRVDNTISGGIFFHAVIQGRNITVQLPPQVTPALSGLPAPTAVFTGRDKDLDRLLADLAPGRGGRRAVLVSAVAGLAGIDKTELAVPTAARALKEPGWFPGGVLFVDMVGYHEDPDQRVTPERALDGLLRALAVPAEHIPDGLQDRQRLYRSVLAAYAKEQRRILVVVDNASSAAQACPLLPTDGTTAALVTSRHTLDGVDARLYDLGKLDAWDEDEQARSAGESGPSCRWPASRGLMDAALRATRGDADTRIIDDPQAAETIAALCDGLPLALRIAAAILAAAPHRPAAFLAADLRDEHTRLDELQRLDGASREPSERRAVRASFNLSPDRAARVLRPGLRGCPHRARRPAARRLPGPGRGQKPARRGQSPRRRRAAARPSVSRRWVRRLLPGPAVRQGQQWPRRRRRASPPGR